MTLLELKRALAKFGGDDDKSHVIVFTVGEDKKLKPGLISAVGLLPTMNAIFLADQDAVPLLAQREKEQKEKMQEPEES